MLEKCLWGRGSTRLRLMQGERTVVMDETFEKVAAWCKPTMEHPLAIVLGSGLG